MYFVYFAAIFLVTLCNADKQRIKHIVVLMEENRSFDHLLGFLPGVNGLKGTETNPISTTQPNSPVVQVTKNAQPIAPCDPNHSTEPTTYKIFGAKNVKSGVFPDPAPMIGFAEEENYLGNGAANNYCGVLDMFTPDKLPIMTTLASEYVLMDRFFASIPGPTWPNRMFFLAASAGGSDATGPWFNNTFGKLFPQKTFLDQVAEGGGTWKNYYNDTPWEGFMESIAYNPDNVVHLDQFFEDAATGNLPTVAWINPRLGVNLSLGLGSNDQHPDHDIALGEAYIKDIYEAVRNSPQWNETLLIVTYDEHGGYYDHVPPPMQGIPSPGDYNYSYPTKFGFDRLGIRIPTLLISPWVPKNMVISAPPDPQKPTNTSEYDLTSIMATMRKLLPELSDSFPLTKRDAWSATFEHVFNILDAPRTDCPYHLPDALPPSPGHAEREALLPLNTLHEHVLEVNFGLLGLPKPTHITQQGQTAVVAKDMFQQHKQTIATWRQSKQNHGGYGLRMVPWLDPHYVALSWNVSQANGVTILSIIVNNSLYCLDSGNTTEKTVVSISWCYPNGDPRVNRDVYQQWDFRGDGTIRPLSNTSLCVTQHYYEYDLAPITLEACVGKVQQAFGYMGIGYPGMAGDDGSISSEGSVQINVVKL